MASRVDIYLKSGSVVTLDVEEFSATRGVAANDLREINWTLADADEGNKPLFIDLGEVAAIIEAR